MNWQILAGLSGVLGAVITALNALLALRSRADLAELKLSLHETLHKEREELRQWATEEFVREDIHAAQLDTLRAQFSGPRRA